MPDRVTKILLGIIALALSTLAVGQFVRPAAAQYGGCGQAGNPCYVWIVGSNISH